jgi:hypothetical protein
MVYPFQHLVCGLANTGREVLAFLDAVTDRLKAGPTDDLPLE